METMTIIQESPPEEITQEENLIDIYKLLPDGSLQLTDGQHVDCYILAKDIGVLQDPQNVAYLLHDYGENVGIVQDEYNMPTIETELVRKRLLGRTDKIYVPKKR